MFADHRVAEDQPLGVAADHAESFLVNMLVLARARRAHVQAMVELLARLEAQRPAPPEPLRRICDAERRALGGLRRVQENSKSS